MTSGISTVIFPVHDLGAAKALYTSLLGAPASDQPYYVGWDVGGQDVGLDPNGHGRGMTGPVPFWHVDDIDARVEALVAAGAQVREPVTDVGGGTLIAMLADGDGNVFGLRRPAPGH